MTRRLKIIISGTVLLGTTAYIIVNRTKMKNLIKKLNIAIDEETDVHGDFQDLATNKIFSDPSSYRNAPASQKLTSAKAIEYAKDIHDAWSIWGDNESQVYTVLDSLQYKVQLAQVEVGYKSLYKVSLYYDMKDRMSKAEMNIVKSIIDKLK